MPYTAEQLETIFLQAGQIRKGNPNYTNDSGYWTGDTCNWGANHVLKEDCREIAKAFGKLESLDNINQELQKATSKSEFETKKNNYLTKCNEILAGLNQNSHSSMFGICIIWSDQAMSHHIQRIMTDGKQQMNNVKSSLNNLKYDVIEELNQINLEIRLIEQKMEENKQKAMNETDPIKRSKLVALIEEDGKVLQQKLSQRAKLENMINFDARSYVRDFVEAMKRAIAGDRSGSSSGSSGSGSGGGGSGNNPPPRTPYTPTNTNFGGNSTNTNGNSKPPKKDKEESTANQSQLFMIVAVLLVLFLMMNKNSDESSYRNHYYDY